MKWQDMESERINRGLTLRDLSERTGVSKSVIARSEAGQRPRKLRDAKVLADYYGVQVLDLWPMDREAA